MPIIGLRNRGSGVRIPLAAQESPPGRHGPIRPRLLTAEILAAVRDRFLRRVDVSPGPDACHPWVGGSSSGYGTFNIGGHRYFAHRIACELAHGPPPSPDLFACHSQECTTRRCTNGKHLRWDNQSGNLLDAVALGKMRGESAGMSTISEQQAIGAWKLRETGLGATAIARQMGLTVHAASAIVRGRTWFHVTGAPRYVPVAQRQAAASMLLAGRGEGGTT